MVDKVRCVVLGATGTVGQRLITMLHDHPSFAVGGVAASGRSAGVNYRDAVETNGLWLQETPIPENVATMIVRVCEVDALLGFKCAFSALPADQAMKLEPELAAKGVRVFSNASAYRMDPQVPLLLPLVNPLHLQLVKFQDYGSAGGFIVCNPNCSTVGLVTALKSLVDGVGEIKNVTAATLQAVSGAGFPGLSVMSLLGNVVPHIEGEEDKIQRETKKILGEIINGEIEESKVVVSASCHRVPVMDGHIVSFSTAFVESDGTEKDEYVQKVKDALTKSEVPVSVKELRSAPERSVVFIDRLDRPQPRLDCMVGGGFSTVVGKVRPCLTHDVKMVTLAHNTVIGAAGGSILNAEFALSQGFF